MAIISATDDFTMTLKIPLMHGDDTELETRNISIPQPNTSMNDAQRQQVLEDFRSNLSNIENYEYLFQPTAWRDYDTTEQAWQLRGGVSAITMEYVSKRTSIYG